MARVYLGLGSNAGDAEAQIENAVSALSEKATVIMQSPVYETRPFGESDERIRLNFLNSAVFIETTLEPQALRTWVKEIEKALGRLPRGRNGSREIDIDILLYDKLVIKEDLLVIPHVGLTTRDFVIIPLLDINPYLCDPCSGKPLRQCLSEIQPEDRYVFMYHPRNLSIWGI